MFAVYGTRKICIRKFTDNSHACASCRTFDLGIKIYQGYQHFYWIPVYPVGDKTVEMRCNNCSEPYRSTVREKEVTQKVRKPFYLYSLPILLVLIIGAIVLANLNSSRLNRKYLSNPQKADVYLMKSNERNFESFYFMKVQDVKQDSVFLQLSNLQYLFSTSAMDTADFFRKEVAVMFSKNTLLQQLSSGEIQDVFRHYDKSKNFDREQ